MFLGHVSSKPGNFYTHKMNTIEQPPAVTAPPAIEKAAPIPRPPKKIEMRLRVNYSRDEIVDLAKLQGEAFGEHEHAREEKKAINSQLKAKVEGIAARISEITSQLRSGFEYRMTACESRYDDPRTGMKTVYRLDTNEIVSCEAMSLSELQTELPLSDNDKVVAFSPPPAPEDPKAKAEAHERDVREIAKQKKSADRLAKKKVTPGTVETDADEGSRDDAGPDGKNDL